MASTLLQLAPGVWAAEHDLTLAGAIHFRARMTALKLEDGSIALISPIPIDAELGAELDALGPVTHLVSPSSYHHLYLRSARERYPNARVHAPPGLAEKRKNLPVDDVLATDPTGTSGVGHGLDHRVIAGAERSGDVCFFHAPSRTLVVADLVFNIHEYEGFTTGMVLRMSGVHGRLTTSRLWRALINDRKQVRESVERVLRWDFNRLVVAHGRVIEENAHSALEAALAWSLKG